MNFFIRHRKILARHGAVPAFALVFVAACFVFFHPAHVPWHLFLNYFFSGPLDMALEFVVVVTMLSYQTHHLLTPTTPKHRAYFVAGALFLGLIIDGIYNERLSWTADFASSSAASQFLACAVIFYSLYRLVLLMPDRERKWVTTIFTAILSFHLIYSGYGVYKKVSAGYPCASGVAPDLWYIIVYKYPRQHCVIQ